ncbi:MAG: translational GTPase TypA [Dehalococcoidia bacterium]|nr:translational GTPase TypA [Dehalococcoidia bacterium]
MPVNFHNFIRNIAIIAHVDHGKTSLVDAMLKFSRIFRDNQSVGELILDSDPLEKERGITILAKNTGIIYKETKINIIDTPGHVDFSGEVERVMNMADGCLLVVDAVEGPMPQTRYVLKTAMNQGLKPVVVINKVDRTMARISEVEAEIQDLFLDTATDAEQLEYPVVYVSAKEGYAYTNGSSGSSKKVDMVPLFDAILEHVPSPSMDNAGPFQMLVAALDHDPHLGQIAIGRVFRGSVKKGDDLVCISDDDTPALGRVNSVFSFENLARKEVVEVYAGDIVAITGMPLVSIGDTLSDPEKPDALPRISIEEPTVQMTFGVNTSPFAGKDGRYATSRMLFERLQKELQTNVALTVQSTDSADEFLVSGRGELHLAILIENIRREGLELQVSRPEAVTRIIDGVKKEPYERLTINTRDEFVGILTEELSSRLARMTKLDQDNSGVAILEFEIPTRGLIGFRSFFLKAARGDGLINSEILDMRPIKGEVKFKRMGAITSSESGIAVTYGLLNAQEKGITFIDPGTQVYEGMVIGLQNREGDLNLNTVKERKQTNMRSATAEITQRLSPASKPTLEEALELILEDEFLEITPKSLRLRKRILSADLRHRNTRARLKSKQKSK